MLSAVSMATGQGFKFCFPHEVCIYTAQFLLVCQILAVTCVMLDPSLWKMHFKAIFENLHAEAFVLCLSPNLVYSDLAIMSPYWLLQAFVRLLSCICHSELLNFSFR